MSLYYDAFVNGVFLTRTSMREVYELAMELLAKCIARSSCALTAPGLFASFSFTVVQSARGASQSTRRYNGYA